MADSKKFISLANLGTYDEKIKEYIDDKDAQVVNSISETLSTDYVTKTEIKDYTDAIDVLNGTGKGSVDQKITDAFNTFSTDVSNDDVVNSYKELIDWAAEHGGEAAEIAGAITDLQKIVAGIGGTGESATVVAHVAAAIGALKIEDYAKSGDLTAAIEAEVLRTEGAYVKQVTGKGLSENDLTDALKVNYDAAYAHSVAEHAPVSAQANVIEGVKVNGTALGITDKVVDITVPTNLSDLNNDAGYVLNSQIEYADDSDIEAMFTTAESQ